MRQDTQQKLIQLIENNVAAGFVRGQELFAENVDQDMEKQLVLENVSIDGVLDYLVQQHNRNVRN